jgi:hypothetical protein
VAYYSAMWISPMTVDVTRASCGKPLFVRQRPKMANESILRHLLAFATVGWYLIIPPPSAEHSAIDPDASLSEWNISVSFDSARQCENARGQLAKHRHLLGLATRKLGAMPILALSVWRATIRAWQNSRHSSSAGLEPLGKVSREPSNPILRIGGKPLTLF